MKLTHHIPVTFFLQFENYHGNIHLHACVHDHVIFTSDACTAKTKEYSFLSYKYVTEI